MPYQLQQSVSAQGHYITLPSLIENLTVAVSALRAERSKGNTCRIVSVRPPARGEIGTQYEPIDIPDTKAATALVGFLKHDAYVTPDDEADWGLDYTTRDGIAGLAVLIMERVNSDFGTEVFPVDESTLLNLDGLNEALAACDEISGDIGGDPLVLARSLLCTRLDAARAARLTGPRR